MSEYTCWHCRHFVDDPAAIEAAFPYLTVFGSAYASYRGEAGICNKFELFLDPKPARECAEFELGRVERGTRAAGDIEAALHSSGDPGHDR